MIPPSFEVESTLEAFETSEDFDAFSISTKVPIPVLSWPLSGPVSDLEYDWGWDDME